VAATFSALATRYLNDHFGVTSPARVWVMVGDAELDEGNVWEALLEEALPCVPNVTWIVDVNRQSLDRITPDARPRQLAALFAAHGWEVIELRWGAALQRHERLCARLGSLAHGEYHRLLRTATLPAPPTVSRGDLRKALVTLPDGGIDRALDAELAGLTDGALASSATWAAMTSR
jgi:pyruvate dehydrogenase E1 component